MSTLPKGTAVTGNGLQTSGGPVVIVHAAMDQLWAEWAAGHLARAGLKPRRYVYQSATGQTLIEQVDQATADGGRLVLILTPRLKVVVGRPEPEWERAVEHALSLPGQVIPIIVDRFPSPASVWGLAPVNLAAVTEPAKARRRLLAALRCPIDHIDETASELDTDADEPMRYPGNEPRVMNSYFPPRERAFTGRHQQLQAIRDLFDTGEDDTRTVALHGMGGIGKSAIAVEYAHRYRAAYDVVWWIDATNRMYVRDQMAELGDKLGAQGREIGERVRFARDALRTGTPHRPCLVIFDGADNLKDIRPELPPSSRYTHILVTSRDPNWQFHCNGVEIDLCQRLESVAYLRRMHPELSEQDADFLAETTGDLPLALFHAVGWLRGSGSARQYAAVIEQLMRAEVADPTFRTGHATKANQTIATTWAASFNALRGDDRSQATVFLYLLAYLAPITVRVELLRSIPKGILSAAEAKLLEDDTSVNEMLEKIKRNALARDHNRPEYLEMHPMVQHYIRATLSGSAEEDRYRRAAQHALVAASPGDPARLENARRYAELISHFSHAGVPESSDPAVRELLLTAVASQIEQGEYTAAVDLVGEAEKSWAISLDPADPLLLRLRRWKAIALRGLGHYQLQLKLDQESWELAKRAYGERSERALRAASGISAALTWLGRMAEARQWSERFYDGVVATFEPDSRDILRAAFGRANFLRLASAFQEALKLDEATYAKYCELDGPEHNASLQTRTKIARDLRELGRHQEALALQEANLADCRQFLGRWAPTTLAAMSELVVIRRRAGRFEQAYELSDRALELYAARFGAGHLEYLAVLTNHAGILRPIGRVVQGTSLARTAYESSKAVLAPEHPMLAATATNYAVFLRSGPEADPVAALELDKEAHDRLVAQFGERNHYTLACRINLANSFAAVGDLEQAKQLHASAYEILVELRGPGHGHTLVAGLNLVIDFDKLGEPEAALELRARLDEDALQSEGMTGWESDEIAAGRHLSCDLDLPLF
jgi:tetratricopeptide (TPR) repeat protein